MRIRRVALLAHTEQSAHQTNKKSTPNIDIDFCVHTYSPLRAVAVSTASSPAKVSSIVRLDNRNPWLDKMFKQCISRMFVKITMAMLMGAFFLTNLRGWKSNIK